MGQYKSICLVSGDKLVEEDGLPDIFLEAINKNWVANNKRVVAILLNNPDKTCWSLLGEMLVQGLSVTEISGMALSGTLSNEIREWINSILSSRREGLVCFGEQHTQHPIHPQKIITNSTFLSIQNKRHLNSMNLVWDKVSSNFLNGCNLIMSFYSDKLIVQDVSDDSFSLQTFLDTLSVADSWLIPLDEYIGFIVGFDIHSTFETRLNDIMR